MWYSWSIGRWDLDGLRNYDRRVNAGRRTHTRGKRIPLKGELLERASDLREDVVGVRSDHPNRSYDDYQDHRQHYRVLGDILAFFIIPELLDPRERLI